MLPVCKVAAHLRRSYTGPTDGTGLAHRVLAPRGCKSRARRPRARTTRVRWTSNDLTGAPGAVGEDRGPGRDRDAVARASQGAGGRADLPAQPVGARSRAALRVQAHGGAAGRDRPA